MRLPNSSEILTQSSVVTFLTGINGTTSIAPRRGCSPLWLRISIFSAAALQAFIAPSIMPFSPPAKVTTTLL